MNVNMYMETVGTADGLEADVETCTMPAPLDVEVPEPVVRIREEHNISRRDIDPDALKVLYRLSRNNYTAYLVGGGVRDLLLGRKPKDFDISTNARPEQIKDLFRNCILIGRRFRLAHIRYGEKIIETSTFRRTPECPGDPNDPDADLFQRNDNLFGTPQEDALRRDFTVNGLFYDIETFSIIDYVGGMQDLADRRIRCIGDPCIRFREDPVRMVRAIRFASRLDFTLDPETLEAIQKHGDELSKAAPARILEEISRLFAFSSGERSVRLLHGTGLLRVLLPEVAACLDDPRYDQEAFWDRLRALDTGDTVLPDATPALIFAILLLDPLQRKLERQWEADDFPRLKFEKVHSFLEPISLRLRFPRKLVDRIVHMFLSQNRFNQAAGGKRGSIANFVTQESFHESLALAEILLTAHGGPQFRLNQWRDMLAERIYGREEGIPGERRRVDAQPANAAAENTEETGDDGDSANGRKMSRSARRRRNKRLKRQRGQDTGEEKTESTLAEGQAANVGKESPVMAEEPVVTAEAPETSTVASETAAIVNATPAEASEKRSRSSKSRGRGGRGRKKAEAGHATPAVSENAMASEVTTEEVPEQPLTAATFYLKPPEPEPEPKSRRRGKSGSAKNGVKDQSTKKEAAVNSAEETKPQPPAMDKADEADIPMHWLDEI